MKNSVKQVLENLPKEILALPRFLKTRTDKPKAPTISDWQNPKKQKLYSKLDGTIGFVASTEFDDSFIFYDFDHALNDRGEFINNNVEKWVYSLGAGKYYCELSQSGKGLHIFAKPTIGKFPKGRRELDLGDGAKLEIFYGTTKFCLATGNLFHCEPNAPIAHAEAADNQFQALLDEIIAKQNKNTVETKQGGTAELIYQSAENTSNNLGIEYDLFRAELMLKVLSTVNHKDLSYNKWLAVITACKNIGVPYASVAAFCQCDPTNYNAEENKKRWEGLNNPSMGIETIHGIAKQFGYQEKDARSEWYKLHPELTTEIIHRPEPMTDDEDEQQKYTWTQDKIKSCPINLKLSSNYLFGKSGIVLVIPPKKETDAPKYITVAKTPILPTKKFREPVKGTIEYEFAIFADGVWGMVELDGGALADVRELSKALAKHGALIDEPKILAKFINSVIAINSTLPRIKSYNRTGWTDDNFTTFAYPGNDDCIVRRAGFDFDRTLATRGDAELWKKKFVEVLDKGGAVAAMYIGTGLAAVLARPLNILNPQTHLQGTSGSGKTALQKFTASISGNPRKLLRTFAATNKNRQLVAAAFCDMPSFFDELETLQGKAAEENLSNDIYNFAEGKGNQANRRDGTARETFEFGGARLTTGERPILKQHDLRGAYKRLIQLVISGKLFDDDFAADLHIFSESNFGHYGLSWIQFATAHMQEIQKEYQRRASRRDPTTKPYEPTHLKQVSACLVAVEFFKVMLGVTTEFDSVSFIRNWRAIVDTLPTVAEFDDTARAIEALSSYVAAHEKSFIRDETNDENGKPIEIGAWGTTCSGKIFDTGEVAFHPTELKRILEDELKFASADKLIAEWNEQGNLLFSDKGRTTHLIRIGSKVYRTVHFRANVISTDIDSAEEKYYEGLTNS